MKQSLLEKLEQASLRLEEINMLLADSATNKPETIKELSIEYTQLMPIVDDYKEYITTKNTISEAEELLQTNDEELRLMAKDELKSAKDKLAKITLTLQKKLLPKDKNDSSDVILEIRAGTGGDEASIFSGNLLKMYLNYAQSQDWYTEVITGSIGEHGGFKLVIVKIVGSEVYSKLKFESGTHRVQRIPETESQGRIHTSACTVAVMPEVKSIEEVDINIKDIRIDTFRASGAGGQHVNKTDSAVRVTHIPTGVVVECQDGRSQHKNKTQALSVLASRILDAKQQEQQKSQSATRKKLIGSGDRSERIRTYNYPQGRLSDHRINLTLYKLLDILAGDLEQVIKPLIIEQQAQLLSYDYDI